MVREAETIAVKNALIQAGYTNLTVGHGRGTARGWIEIVLYGNYTHDDYLRAYAIAKHAAGRDNRHDDISSDYFVENIQVEIRPASDRPGPRPKAKFSTKGAVEVVKDEAKQFPNGSLIRRVDIKVGDYIYLFEHWSYPRNPRGHITYRRYDPHYPKRWLMSKRDTQWDPQRLIEYFKSKQPALAQVLQQRFGHLVSARSGPSPVASPSPFPNITMAQTGPIMMTDLQAAAGFLGPAQAPPGYFAGLCPGCGRNTWRNKRTRLCDECSMRR